MVDPRNAMLRIESKSDEEPRPGWNPGPPTGIANGTGPPLPSGRPSWPCAVRPCRGDSREELLRKPIQVAFPCARVVTVVVHVPNVGNFMLLQIGMPSLTNAQQAILVPAAKPEKF